MAREIATIRPQPLWVVDLVERLDLLDKTIVDVQDRLMAIGLELRGRDLDDGAQELNEAFHDTEHLWEHITRTRRALRMSWPDEDLAQ